MSSNFYISPTNPNDAQMGGCACHPTKCDSCVGPFAVFPETEMEGIGSPHVVLGASCAHEISSKIDSMQYPPDPDPYDAPVPVAEPKLESAVEAEPNVEAQTRLAEAAAESTETPDVLDPATGEPTGNPIGEFFKGVS